MAVEPVDPRLNPNSTPGRGAYPIPLAAVTTTGFLGRAERGPVNEPVCIESFAEYRRYFGGHLADGAMSHAVQDYFLHGGSRAVIVRIANGARRARLDVPTGGAPLALEARYPGRHELLRISIDYEQAEQDPDRFNLVVQRLGCSGSAQLIEDQELYPLISVRPDDERYIGKVLSLSRLVALAGSVPGARPLATPPFRPGEPVRYVGLTAPGNDGAELTDYDIIGSDRNGTGLFAFGRGPRIDLLVISLPPEKELGSTAFVAATRFCERGRGMLIWDPPLSWQSVDAALLGSRRLDFASRHVLTYFPRIRPRGARVRYAGGLSAAGAVAGMLARRERRGVFGRDEDTDFILRTALAPLLDLNASDAQRLARYGINAFVRATGGATRLVGRVTMGVSRIGTSTTQSLERQRLASFILTSIEDAVAGTLDDYDRREAQARCAAQLERFFRDLHTHGALKGRTAGQAYYVAALPAEQGRFGLRFGVALAEPGRFAEYAVDLTGDRPARIRENRGPDYRGPENWGSEPDYIGL